MIRTAGIAVAAALLISTAAFGRQGAGPMAQGSRGRMHAGMMENLKLSDQQQAQLQKLRFAYAKKKIQLNEKIQLARLDLRELLAADQPDKAAVEKAVKTVSDLQYQQKVDLIDHLFDVKGILTPDQVKIWKEHLMRNGRMLFRSGRNGGSPGFMEQRRIIRHGSPGDMMMHGDDLMLPDDPGMMGADLPAPADDEGIQ